MRSAVETASRRLSGADVNTRRVEIELPYRPLWEIARAMIGKRAGVVFLDSGGPAAGARWSYLAWGPSRVVAWPQGREGAAQELRACFGQPGTVSPPSGRLPFHGGWMGWFGYDLGRHFERLPDVARADAEVPDFVIGAYDRVLVEDRLEERLYAAGRCRDDAARERLAAWGREAVPAPGDDGIAGISEPLARRDAADHASSGSSSVRGRDGSRSAADAGNVTVRAHTAPHVYRRNVERILRHIRDGDIYQANYSHRFEATTTCPSATLYARLRDATPAPFACYIDLPGAPEILSASPELFLRRRGRHLSTMPIKGTRRRDPDPDVDAALLEELRASPKERAELLMITDLLRNDLGRVAEYGSVSVPRLRALESHPTVHHAYSIVEARTRRDVGPAEILAATLPGGSVTGAPKIRAMQILEELEPLRRGPYTGAAGFIGHDGDLSLSILIRTLVRQGDRVWYQVGGGIVADSDPHAEYEETLAKGAALRRALQGLC